MVSFQLALLAGALLAYSQSDEDVSAAEKVVAGGEAGAAKQAVTVSVGPPRAEDNKKEPEPEFQITAPMVLTPLQRLVWFFLVLVTAGFGQFLLWPWFHYDIVKENVRKIRLQGKELRFKGTVKDFYLVYLETGLWSFVTFGIYWLLGYPELRVAQYIDSHLALATHNHKDD